MPGIPIGHSRLGAQRNDALGVVRVISFVDAETTCARVMRQPHRLRPPLTSVVRQW